MNKIIYLNDCSVNLTDIGEVVVEARVLNPGEYTLDERPTKCKVTINDRIVIDDVFVFKKDNTIFLYESYSVVKTGFTTEKILINNGPWGWAKIEPKNLILEFKSNNYIIEKYEILPT